MTLIHTLGTFPGFLLFLLNRGHTFIDKQCPFYVQNIFWCFLLGFISFSCYCCFLFCQLLFISFSDLFCIFYNGKNITTSFYANCQVDPRASSAINILNSFRWIKSLCCPSIQHLNAPKCPGYKIWKKSMGCSFLVPLHKLILRKWWWSVMLFLCWVQWPEIGDPSCWNNYLPDSWAAQHKTPRREDL